jgi:hypothetical protein
MRSSGYWPDAGWESPLVDAMREDLAESATEDLVDETLLGLLDPLTAAESFDLGKALGSIAKGASGALSDPTVRQIAQVALPVAGGALGTAVGGPVGTALGSKLGGVAAANLPGAPKPAAAPAATPRMPAVQAAAQPVAQPPAQRIPQPAPVAQPVAQPAAQKAQTAPAAQMAPAQLAPVPAEAPAALKALALTHNNTVLNGLLAAALGAGGRQVVAGVPIAALLSTLSSIFGQAAAEADQVARSSGSGSGIGAGTGSGTGFLGDSEELDAWTPPDDAVYASVVAAEALDLEEAWP